MTTALPADSMTHALAEEGWSVQLRPLQATDYPVVFQWATSPHAEYWPVAAPTLEAIRDEYDEIAQSCHHSAWMGSIGGEDRFLVETYDPAYSEWAGPGASTAVSQLYMPVMGDVGMHILVAPPTTRQHGTTRMAFTAAMRLCFNHLRARRVVVEPDCRNTKIRAKNLEAGFVELGDAPVPGKTATISVCTRGHFARSDMVIPRTNAPHLNPCAAAAAHRFLTAKLLRELVHERLLSARKHGAGDDWSIHAGGDVSYHFTAAMHPLEHLDIHPATLERRSSDVPGGEPPNVLQAVQDVHELVGLHGERQALYIQEMAATLAARCFVETVEHDDVATVVDLDAPALEAAMTEGHPGFVATNGRIGFSDNDYRDYAPEASTGAHLIWVAARKDSTGVWRSKDATLTDPIPSHISKAWLRVSQEALVSASDYTLMPVHPWQWHHKVVTALAPDVASRKLIYVCEDTDVYTPLQSLRTWSNVTTPEAPYVKTSLSIQNMGFTRGLSPAYMSVTPAITDFVHDMVSTDTALATSGFQILREYATAGYTGDAFHASGNRSDGTKLLAALWRENPLTRIEPGDKLMTMASLLHWGSDRRPVVCELIGRSGLDPHTWLRSYLRSYITPLLHLMTRYGAVFMPHGENIILVLRHHRVVGVFLKDIGEEVVIAKGGGDVSLDVPDNIARIVQPLSDDDLRLSFFTDMLDGFLRHLGPVFSSCHLAREEEFWGEISGVVREFVAANPSAERFDFFSPTFPHSCLNRLQLRDPRSMVDLANPADSLIYAGALRNPLADTL